MTREPRRQQGTGLDHFHPEYWGKDDHWRFEERVQSEIHSLERAVEKLTTRVTLMLGGLTLVAVLLPVIAPFVRSLLNLSTPLP